MLRAVDATHAGIGLGPDDEVERGEAELLSGGNNRGIAPASVSSHGRVWAEVGNADISARSSGRISMIRDDDFRLLFEAAPNGVVVVDQAGAIVFVNAQTENFFGYSRGELIGLAVELLIPEQFRPTHAALRDQFGKNPQPRPMGAGRDLCGRRKDGSEFPVEIGISPFRSGDRALVIASVIDVINQSPFQIRSATGQHRRHGGVSGGGKGRGQGL